MTLRGHMETSVRRKGHPGRRFAALAPSADPQIAVRPRLRPWPEPGARPALPNPPPTQDEGGRAARPALVLRAVSQESSMNARSPMETIALGGEDGAAEPRRSALAASADPAGGRRPSLTERRERPPRAAPPSRACPRLYRPRRIERPPGSGGCVRGNGSFGNGRSAGAGLRRRADPQSRPFGHPVGADRRQGRGPARPAGPVAGGRRPGRVETRGQLWERSAASRAVWSRPARATGVPSSCWFGTCWISCPPLWACLRAGAMAVPLAGLAADRDLGRGDAALRDALARLADPLLLFDPGFADWASEAAADAHGRSGPPSCRSPSARRPRPSRPIALSRSRACLIPTSGSTGASSSWRWGRRRS